VAARRPPSAVTAWPPPAPASACTSACRSGTEATSRRASGSSQEGSRAMRPLTPSEASASRSQRSPSTAWPAMTVTRKATGSASATSSRITSTPAATSRRHRSRRVSQAMGAAEAAASTAATSSVDQNGRMSRAVRITAMMTSARRKWRCRSLRVIRS